jgi:pre-mRNA branch site protein p14
VVYEDIYDAKAAADHLSGFNVANRYLIVLFYAPARQAKKLDQARRSRDLSLRMHSCRLSRAALTAASLQTKKEEELTELKTRLAATE